MGRKTGRNEPCPCGSEKKYKKCCGSPEAQGETTSMEMEAARAAMHICTAEVAEKWTKYYSDILKDAATDPVLKDQPVPLPFLIEKFAKGITPWVEQNYPFMLPRNGSAQLFWLMLLGAVLESGTCNKHDVEQAFKAIQKLYS